MNKTPRKSNAKRRVKHAGKPKVTFIENTNKSYIVFKFLLKNKPLQGHQYLQTGLTLGVVMTNFYHLGCHKLLPKTFLKSTIKITLTHALTQEF